MKKILKNMLPLFLILIVVFSAISPLQVKAAKRGKYHNIEMYVGEAYEYTNYSKVKSIKNTKKSVVETSKKKNRDNYIVFQAKKAGKAKITAKTQSGTAFFNITVKEAKFEYRLYTTGSGEVLAEVTNKNKVIFEEGTFRYTLKGSDGAEFASEEIRVPALMPNSKSYVKIYFSSSAFEPDVSQSEIKMISLTRSGAYVPQLACSRWPCADPGPGNNAARHPAPGEHSVALVRAREYGSGPVARDW